VQYATPTIAMTSTTPVIAEWFGAAPPGQVWRATRVSVIATSRFVRIVKKVKLFHTALSSVRPAAVMTPTLTISCSSSATQPMEATTPATRRPASEMTTGGMATPRVRRTGAHCGFLQHIQM
jgi:hypothetical protein